MIQGGGLPDGAEDTVFLSGDLEQALRTPATDGAFELLSRLSELFERRVWVISKCGPATAQKTRLWLDRHRFWEHTKIPEGNLRFCRRRAEKAVHCVDLGITHMIDDRLDVHRALRGVVEHRYLFGPQHTPVPDWVDHTPTWADVEAAGTADLGLAS